MTPAADDNPGPSTATTPTILRRAVAALLLIALLSGLYITKVAHRMPDFEVYRRAAIRVRSADPLYRADDGHYQFKYLPAFAIAAVPLGMLPESVAKALWYAASLGLLAGMVRLSLLMLSERRKTDGWLVGATFVVLAKFYAHEVELGQVNILLAFLIVASARLMLTGREAAAGLLIAAAIVVKPYALLFVPYVLARRRIASIASVAAGVGLALVLPAIVYGFEGNRDLLIGWWKTVTETTLPNLMNDSNVSAASVFARWLGPGPTASALAAGTGAVLLLVAALVFTYRKGIARPEGLEIGLLLIMTVLLSPQGWDYVFLVSTPAVMCLVNYADRLPRHVRVLVIAALLVIGFSVYDLIGRTAYLLIMSWSLIPMAFMILVAGLATLRLRRVA